MSSKEKPINFIGLNRLIPTQKHLKLSSILHNGVKVMRSVILQAMKVGKI